MGRLKLKTKSEAPSFDIMLSTVHVMNSNYLGCPLKINRILGVKDERFLNKTNIVDSFKIGSGSLNVI